MKTTMYKKTMLTKNLEAIMITTAHRMNGCKNIDMEIDWLIKVSYTISISPRFGLRHVAHPCLIKGYVSLCMLECLCFHTHFQDISTKMHLFDMLPNPVSSRGIFHYRCWSASAFIHTLRMFLLRWISLACCPIPSHRGVCLTILTWMPMLSYTLSEHFY